MTGSAQTQSDMTRTSRSDRETSHSCSEDDGTNPEQVWAFVRTGREEYTVIPVSIIPPPSPPPPPQPAARLRSSATLQATTQSSNRAVTITDQPLDDYTGNLEQSDHDAVNRDATYETSFTIKATEHTRNGMQRELVVRFTVPGEHTQGSSEPFRWAGQTLSNLSRDQLEEWQDVVALQNSGKLIAHWAKNDVRHRLTEGRATFQLGDWHTDPNYYRVISSMNSQPLQIHRDTRFRASSTGETCFQPGKCDDQVSRPPPSASTHQRSYRQEAPSEAHSCSQRSPGLTSVGCRTADEQDTRSIITHPLTTCRRAT